MPSRPFFLFAHGAGAPSSSAWMVAWRDRLASLGGVTAFDYPYMRAGRKTPDRLPALIAAHRAALAEARARAKGPAAVARSATVRLPEKTTVAHRAWGAERLVFLIGKSMGGRVGCHVALEETVAGVICLGYPLQSGATGAMRDEVLIALRTPILFVQGSRDSLCSLDKLAAVRARMTAPSTLLVVAGGNHSLEVSAAERKASGVTQADSDAGVLEAIGVFVASAAG
jgi:predicted alpha/beta-hydrolase family hydrolase